MSQLFEMPTCPPLDFLDLILKRENDRPLHWSECESIEEFTVNDSARGLRSVSRYSPYTEWAGGGGSGSGAIGKIGREREGERKLTHLVLRRPALIHTLFTNTLNVLAFSRYTIFGSHISPLPLYRFGKSFF